MAKYKEYDYSQGKFIPLSFDKQILPGTFEHTLHYLIDNEIDLSAFDLCYKNDETGAPAYDPRILLKIVLYAYSKGITSSRKMKDLAHKKEKMEKAIKQIIVKHKERDGAETDKAVIEKEEQYISTLKSKVKKIKTWLAENDDKPGSLGKPRKSNITDNESATMKTSHGVIQGYNGVAMVDSKHQVVVHAEATGDSEPAILKPMVEGTRENFNQIKKEEDIFKKAKLSADSGFHSEKNMEMVIEGGIDAYIADNKFRQRDPRFNNADRYKERFKKERAKQSGAPIVYQPRDFTVSPDKSFCTCPAGKRMYLHGNVIHNGLHIFRFKGTKRDCIPCQTRAKCLKKPDLTQVRQFAYFTGNNNQRTKTFTQKMREKIDSVKGKLEYAKRMATVEPVFADIRSSLGLDRFSLRGKKKVGVQWRLYCIVHNLLKVHRYGPGFAYS